MSGAFERFAVGGLMALLLPCPLAAANLRAGVARVDITPPTGLSMYGYANRKGGATR